MKRILAAVACLLPFGLAAEAGINRHSPEAAVKAVYKAYQTAIEGRGPGIMADNTLRARFFSRSLLRSIAADLRATVSQLAIGRVLDNPAVDVAIVGTRNAEHVTQAVAAVDLVLSAQDRARIDAVMEHSVPVGGPSPEAMP